jgi:metallo-beta-lactamase class B
MKLFRFLEGTSTSTPEAINPSRRRMLAMGCACCALAAGGISPAAAQLPGVQNHLAAAKQAAQDDLLPYLRLGQVADPTQGGAPGMTPDQLMRLPAPPPGQAFDNLYFVGSKWVSAWVIATSQGLILVDAMDNDDEAEHIIDAGMRKLGLDPAQIKMVIVTHGHGDHYGGVGYLRRRYAPAVHMGAPDWEMTATQLEFDRPDWGRPPVRNPATDLALKDGDRLRLGDTAIDILMTPGHTLGTVSLLFNAHQGSKVHRTLLWGGTAFNFGRQPDRMVRLKAYIDATARARDIARTQNVEVFISNHNGYDEAVEKLAKMEKAKGAGRNPFVIGSATTQRALTVMNECAQATWAAWQA